MIRSTMDTLSLYNYDHTLLDGLIVPEAIDRDLVIDNILIETAEREVLYSDLDFYKKAIAVWSRKQLPVWEELYKTTQYEYNPIWNKEGTIIETETRNLAGSENISDGNIHVDGKQTVREFNNTDSTEHSENTTSEFSQSDTGKSSGTSDGTSKNTNDRSVYGFNSNTDAPAETITDNGTTTGKTSGETSDNSTGSSSNSLSGSGSLVHTGTVTDTDSGQTTDDRTVIKGSTDTGTIKHERKEYGNIGVTTTQQMIQEQREVVQLNMIDIIVSDFGKRFCLSVY